MKWLNKTSHKSNNLLLELGAPGRKSHVWSSSAQVSGKSEELILRHDVLAD